MVPISKELKQGRTQSERHKTIALLSKNNNSARFARAFYISFPSFEKQQREMIKIRGLLRASLHDDKDFFILSPGTRFSRAPESFRARKANFKSPWLKNQKDP